jgi:hypothetical protein
MTELLMALNWTYTEKLANWTSQQLRAANRVMTTKLFPMP